ncbi:MAG: substrate-binding domain-containing protein [Kiritimatiellae bacterium]|nr:substrate-binding domain-containing protein [Kiritimatiellia bacterium]
MDTILFFQSTLDKSWRDKLAGAYRFARERGWFVQVVSRFATRAEIRRVLKEWQPIGCLVDRGINKGAAPERLFGGLPIVYLDQDPSHPSRIHPCLMHDSTASAEMASEELLKNGLASCAYLGMVKSYFWDTERLVAFRRKARSAGHDVTVLDRRNLRTVLKAIPKPCGVFAANDHCALEVYHAATTMGLAIPEDIALIGIDNDEICCESVFPGITSIEPDFIGAGYRLAQMLDAEINMGERGRARRRNMPTEKYGPLRIVRRGSTNVLSRIDPRVTRAIEFIRRNAYEQGFRIDDVLPEMGCSRRLATMRFRMATGHSILDELHARRLERICDLLVSTNWPISTIIAQSGYASTSFAQRMFRLKTGCTMLAWRRRFPGTS